MLTRAREIAAEIVALRREIHRHPELGYREERTARLVCRQLEALGITFRSGVARTGVVAELRKGDGPTVALRADMDALPIDEATGLPFSSEVPGVMHACGHDAHTAMLLGAARLLAETAFNGAIRLIFQPSEENNENDADGLSGAMRMIAEGVLDGVDAAIALHQAPMLPTGTISLRPGPVLAAADRFEITVHGRSAHAGVNPEGGIDAIVIAAELVSLLQTIVSRHTAPTDPVVLSLGTISGGHAYNIVADRVVIGGTTRALDNSTYRRTMERIRDFCENLGRMHGTTIAYDCQHAVPVTVNDERLTAIARTAAEGIFPAGGILSIPPVLGGEDFACFGQQVPICFALLGTQPPQSPPGSLHDPGMLIDEAALPFGAAWLAETALAILAETGQ